MLVYGKWMAQCRCELTVLPLTESNMPNSSPGRPQFPIIVLNSDAIIEGSAESAAFTFVWLMVEIQ